MPVSVPQHGDGRAGAARRIAVLLLSGLTIATLPAAGLLAQTVQPVEQGNHDPFAAHVAEASLRFGIPAHWIRAVQHVESHNNPQAVSPKGAMGLMQIMPETWAALRAGHALGSDPFDPRDNILAGTAYLREMHDRYGTIAGMLAAYNAGPGRYDEHLISGRTLPAETRAYVAALAPLLGGEPLLGTSSVAAAPPDWREAPLFAGGMTDSPGAEQRLPDGTSAAGSMPSDEPAVESLDAWPAGDGSALAPPSEGLFVRRSDAGSVQ